MSRAAVLAASYGTLTTNPVPAGTVAYFGMSSAPTFTPSILVTWSEPSNVPEEFDDTSKDIKRVCHSFVTEGRIQFLGDCTHALAGQTVDLPDYEIIGEP